ncbi:MAG TPA: asparagine synthase (glutamine-hydrolyzing) [Bacteroidia bacterium]|nr:asparagine synthase (glutamine-hydrolyzing) [Bacteroidia bacterium]HNU34185.1 asparagine synthase (glutamine-hydrolyzing) [Bacteroidia bacterium]
MCGILGLINKDETDQSLSKNFKAALNCLQKRGPDSEGIYYNSKVLLGHRRLSIIDTSNLGAQPMTDASNRYVIIFNGEFFNFNHHKSFVESKGYKLKSHSDTEVLLYLYIIEKEKCLDRINGFFSLAIYDKEDETLFIARDRYGVKPLLIFSDEKSFAFSSEMKSLMSLGIKKEINRQSLLTYLQLNYIPSPYSILNNVRKLLPGSYIFYDCKKNEITEEKKFYHLPVHQHLHHTPSYEEAKQKLYTLLEESVQKRMISDVPLGSFLSGGIDSSVISALAARHTKHLKTFSIGFKDEPMFDETKYAQLVAKKHKTEHTVFKLSNSDLYEVLHDVLNYIDEPFADSSALNVFILSRQTRKHVTVALSGDGADEIFGGYNKHRAEWLIRNNKSFTNTLKLFSPLLSTISGSRNSKYGNKLRQLHRFANGAKQNAANRYWRWCSFIDEHHAQSLLKQKHDSDDVNHPKNYFTNSVTGGSDMNDVFEADVNLVLQGDMLVKVDLMSMANSLEVRTPFLDFEMVNYAFGLPSAYKIDRQNQKKIIKDAFRELLPVEIFKRGKQGFEVPLLKWFRTELKEFIIADLLNDKFIEEQNIFDVSSIRKLKLQLFSNNPGEIHAQIWGLIVFQHWYKKYFLG